MTGHRLMFAAILGLVGHALYQLSTIVGTVQDWSVWLNPPTVMQLLVIGAELVTGIGLALGTDMAKVKDPKAE